ncbi:TIGR03618 family F420-dependent PPOX class oxidoreductase [Herbiconiux sp. KACC 21604]|uniref:TIGR03618 family F420-dependent PPOX class oxidoreductase n=1 Tax=unclassified Herbiconiux TaxID=2618217 RepID=UPI0014927393|nr:TIGR03618 family F420-dependent PPOX class oxidoreductase [Herbiconiux sp. SALV-R1]QJU53359.1 TIGR03618 family F420-dependent PPOX class oxidoreductase [Herbiconiux sp. SALV-R1]WPO88321.1 TIGR03618 family F420-dependent PPOX class oxidoreductase [Herbiconiux sp. KACC 21604]
MATWESTRPYFERAAVAHLATLLPDGAPHSVPVWVGVEGESLAVFMIADSRKDKNLQRDPRVAISVTNPENPLDMASVRGVATRRVVGAEAMEIVDRIAVAYTGEPYELRSGLAAYLIRPEKLQVQNYSG